MSIRRKIIVSNLLMLFIPAVLIVLMASGLLVVFSEIYGTTLDNLKGKSSVLIEIQKTIESLMLHSEKSEEFNINFLNEIMSERGFSLIIKQGNEYVYNSAVGYPEGSPVDYFLGIASDTSGKLMISNDIGSLYKDDFLFNSKLYSIYCVSGYGNQYINPLKSSAEKFLQNYIGILLLTALIIIILTNGIISRNLYNAITKRLELLSDGVHQIMEGNLEYKIKYPYTDEILDLCVNFNEMGSRLKDGVSRQIRDESNRRELIAGISHDLRTPLTAIRAYIEGLIDGVASNPQKIDRYLRTVLEKTNDMINMVDRLFLFSKLDTTNFPFRNTRIELRSYVTDFVNTVKDEFRKKGLDIRLSDNLSQDINIFADETYLKQVLINIIENSVNYKTKETAKLDISIITVDTKTVIELKDDGEGVDGISLDKIFETFYRTDDSRENPGKGSGLGLAISKRIITSFNGNIYAKKYEDGFSIIIELPVL